MPEKHNGLRIAAVYTAVIIGAGFASGQELLKYFVGYGISGAGGLLASGVAFALTGWAVLELCAGSGIHSYAGLMKHLMGERLGTLAEWLVAAFLCVLFSAMLSAAGASAKQALNLPFTLGAAAAGLLCFLVLLFDLEGVIKLNTVLAPFMVAGGIIVGVYTFFNRTASVFSENTIIPSWVLASLVYASYNLVTGIPILVSSSKLVNGKRDCVTGGLAGGLAMTALGLCIALPLYLHYSKIVSVEIPLLMVVIGYGRFFTVLYLAVMLCAVFTTAVSNAFAFIDWLNPKKRKIACAVFCGLGVAGAHLGFSNFVGRAYPLFAFLGFFEMLVILLSWCWSLYTRTPSANIAARPRDRGIKGKCEKEARGKYY